MVYIETKEKHEDKIYSYESNKSNVLITFITNII